MRRIPDLKHLHEFFKRYFLVQFKSPQTDIVEMVLRDEVSDPLENSLEPLLVHPPVNRVEVKYLHKSLTLGRFDRVFVLSGLFILQHSNVYI